MLCSFMAEHSPNARVQQSPEISTADFVGDQNDWRSRSSGDHARHGFEIRFREHDVGGFPLVASREWGTRVLFELE